MSVREITLAAASLVGAAVAPAQTFTGLGFLPDRTDSIAFGISADGSVVVGASGFRAVRWVGSQGIQDLGVPLGSSSANAFAVSGDGSTVACNGVAGQQSPYDYRAFRWTSAGGWQALGAVSFGASSIARGISADGATIIGESYAPAQHAFRWTAGGGIESLGDPPGTTQSAAWSISSDGSVIAGYAGTSTRRSYRWTGAAGWQNLGVLLGGDQSFAYGVSGGGLVIVGSSTISSYPAPYAERAFRWTAHEGLAALPGLDVGNYACSASGDGHVIVGVTDDGGGSYGRAFLWTASLGTVDLNTYLAALGVNLTGWTLKEARGISADGQTIVGSGAHNGHWEAWVVRLGTECYANCDASTSPPLLNVADFICFFARFAAGDPYANCDHSTSAPVLNVADFTCFLRQFAAGCP